MIPPTLHCSLFLSLSLTEFSLTLHNNSLLKRCKDFDSRGNMTREEKEITVIIIICILLSTAQQFLPLDKRKGV